MRFFWLLLTTTTACVFHTQVKAQNPNLPVKGTLSNTLLSSRTFTNASQVDTVVKQRSLPAAYTVEVVARVNSATGRGLDIEARNGGFKGFRLSMAPAAVSITNALTASQALTVFPAATEQTLRVAVKNDSAYVFQNGAFIQTSALAEIKDIVGGTEVSDPVGYSADTVQLMAGWAGTTGNNSGTPAAYGWAYNGTTSTTLFNTANSTSGVRYSDVSATVNTLTLDGATYNGRILFLRWDNNSITGACYTYPVTLAANTTYDFSMLHAYFSNATGSKYITAGIGKTTAVADRIASHTFNSEGTKALKREHFLFTSQEAGTYYLTFTGTWALYTVAELSLVKVNVTPRFIFGKNYPSGAVNMEISSVTFDSGAYMPASILTQTVQNVTVTGTTATYAASINTNYIVAGKTDLHITGDNSPLVNSTVQLNSNDAWLFFDNVKPSVVIANWLSKVYINGVSASGNANVRVGIYKNGTVVIPNGNVTSQAALQVYTGASLGGSSRTMAIHTYYDTLGAFDNNIRSFKLKRGYAATFAANADGTGYSRVFVANDSDLVVNTMPEGLVASASFVRVFKWEWVSKKGWAGGGTPLNMVNATWFYDWNVGGLTSDNQQYAVIRQNGGWPSWTDLNNKQNVSHMLGFNEPDHTDQANLSVEEAIRQWPDMMRSGLRLGSPAPSNPNSWLYSFINKCDSLNYRVDYVAIHCYWNSRTPEQWYSGLKAVYDLVKRPLWITEWNNGANWTGESWPSTVTEQQQKQLNDIKGILNVLDTCSFVERYSIYNWVEDKRAMVLADTLTPAGRYYSANKSDFAYNPQKAFVHTWKLAAPIISGALNSANYFRATLSFKDINGEMGGKYALERKINGVDADFVTVQEFTGYTINSTLSFTDSVYSKATYRVKAYNTALSAFVYSGSYDVIKDSVPQPPASLTGTVLSSSKVTLNWTAASTARSYNLKRGLSASGPFTTIAARTTALTFANDSLTPATTYYYVVTSLNSAGESANSAVLTLTTNALVTPGAVQNPRAGSGDARVTLTWDFMYDARYTILRSSTLAGTYSTLITNVNDVRYVDTAGVVNNSTYYYKVVAYNAAGTGPQSAALSATPKAGQHVHIAFSENTGTVAADVWGGYHAALTNSAVWTTGQSDAAVNLVKTSSSYMQLPAGVVSTLNNFTIAAWVKLPANQGTNTRLFDFGSGTGTFMVLVPKIGETVRYKITCAAGTYDRYISYSVPLDTWVHLTISQSGNVFRFYANGVLQYTDSAATVKPSDMGITSANFLGKSQFSSDPYSDHTYDDFRIYNYALSSQDIQTLAGSTSALLSNTLSVAAAKAPADEATTVQVYPNPASSFLYVKVPGNKPSQYTLLNMNGVVVSKGDVQYGRIALPDHMASGMYMLQLKTGTTVVLNKRIMIMQ